MYVQLHFLSTLYCFYFMLLFLLYTIFICTFIVWDHTKHSKFNFFWWDTSTFLSYQEETSYESSLMVQQSGSLVLSSLHNVFLSLTSNAKSIYILLAEYQLSNANNVNFTGKFLHLLFYICGVTKFSKLIELTVFFC